MPQDEFERQRAALIASKVLRDRALGDEEGRAWEQISVGRYNWLHREREAALLQTLTLADVQARNAAALPGQLID